LTQVLSSRVTDEGRSFVNTRGLKENAFENMLNNWFGNDTAYDEIKQRGKKFFPPPGEPGSLFKSEFDRMSMYSTENSFTCHNRLVANAYAGKTYSVEYAVGTATHGSDQSATFINPTTVSAESIPVRTAFQSYFVSFIRSGDPNKFRNKETIEWPLTTGFDKEMLGNVLRFEQPIGPKGSRLEDDPRQSKDRCQFWTDVQKAIDRKVNQRAAA
jgi:hypothetical protein